MQSAIENGNIASNHLVELTTVHGIVAKHDWTNQFGRQYWNTNANMLRNGLVGS